MAVVRLEDLDDTGDGRRFSPSAARNRGDILEVLRRVLDGSSSVFEIASGTGEHAVHFTAALPRIRWQPTDRDAEALLSIEAWRREQSHDRILPPKHVDVLEVAAMPDDERLASFGMHDAIVAINFFHITPWSACEAFVRVAASLLRPGGVTFVYGAFLRDDVVTAPSNLDFDARLRATDPAYGVRRLEDVQRIAFEVGLELGEVLAMPNNNLGLVFTRVRLVTRGR
ncbi:MAG: DUF938 domain-containing protein [Planctomycetes bacterium]|nr:DUF938 domain-containing protein [Planctomycetota bacterium]